MVFLVSGPSCTPPPLIPLLTPAGPAAVEAAEVEAVGADESKSPESTDGREAVVFGYK